MKFTDPDIQEFANIWKEEFGETLTLDEARIEASLFMELCRLIVQPLPGEPDYSGPPLLTL